VLGGVCAGIARSAGLDPLLLRIAVVAVTVLTGGASVLAYLAAWVLIPREPLDATPGEPAAPPVGASGADARAAWTAAGNDLRSLTTELRRPAAGTDADASTDGEAQTDPGTPAVEPGAIPAPRSPLAAADDAATALGDRLRTPEVQAGARKAAASVTQAVSASVDELARRVRRDRS
jgi:phage shock protein PspC (stress-responsive transcriptional regulator)